MRMMKRFTDYPQIREIFERVKEEKDVAFLDSSLQGELGKYSIIAFKPYLTLVKEEETFTVNGQPCEENFEEYLKKYLQEHEEENETSLPLVSGAIGYFSYDYGRKKEGVQSRHEKTVPIPDCILYFYDYFVIEDHEKQELYLIANGYTEEASTGLQELESFIQIKGDKAGNIRKSGCADEVEKVESSDRKKSDLDIRKKGESQTGIVSANFTSEDYMQAVDHMIRYIIEGDIYVVNMTQQLEIQSDIDPYEMFCRLREKNPSPFGGYLDFGEFQIVCASPERFLKMKDRKINTRPIKGTRKRGETEEEDQFLKEELANSEKDQSELLMIVDLERNDLNRVCVPGSVKVTELFEVETYATVFHLIANVEGILRPELNVADLIYAAFPGGSITGAPKLRAMELIDQEEHSRRNLYTGSIGYISLNGDCDLNIVIRTAVHQNGSYHVGVGGGITCESELEFEYEETWQKAKALLEALNAPRIS